MENIITRRSFLRNSAAGLVGLLAGAAFGGEKKGEFDYLKAYEAFVKKAVDNVNANLKPTAPLEYKTVMAMIAKETGSDEHRQTAFKYDPMQIANQGDYALDILANGKEGIGVLEKALGMGFRSLLDGVRHTQRKKGKWDYSGSKMTGEKSILGGVAYLAHKAAIYGTKEEEIGEILKTSVRRGDSLSKIAKREGTTIETLRKHNPNANPNKLRAGQELQYRKAKIVPCITGWRSWDEAVKRYNGGGNPNYLKEVKAVMARL